MSQIHCRVRGGQPVYRLWSTVCDAYMTLELSRDQLMTELRMEAIRRALDAVERDSALRIERATHGGTSGALGEVRDVLGPWETERGR